VACRLRGFRTGLAGIVFTASLLAASLFSGAALAQQPSAGDIANSLAPKTPTSLTRGLTLPDAKTAREQQFLRGLTQKNTRSITVEETNQVAEIAKDKPAIDLEVNFDYNSATIGPQATDVLIKLGSALKDARLKGATVLLAGHTDAKGGEAYNKDLSDRRAESVKEFLVAKFSLPPESLIALGYGKGRLKNTADPYAAENRRVQVVNMSAQ
jgi:outer membrane protein OmpA-like peptidoglycan-associated protein